jgi:hypothetical protein
MRKLLILVLLAFTASAVVMPVASVYAGTSNAGGGPGNSGPGDKNSPGTGNGKKPGPPK